MVKPTMHHREAVLFMQASWPIGLSGANSILNNSSSLAPLQSNRQSHKCNIKCPELYYIPSGLNMTDHGLLVSFEIIRLRIN